MNLAIKMEAAGRVGQDRAAAFELAGGTLVVVADGAGGVTGGAEAAQAVVDWFRGLEPTGEQDWVHVLRTLDAYLSSGATFGETTAVVVLMTTETIVGASVGDSGAWMLASGIWRNLLESQRRKPLLGTGSAVPTGFGPFPLGERVLLGSDGLFKYVALERIERIAAMSSLESAAHAFVEAARLPSGRLQDDITVVIAGEPGSLARCRNTE
jgi:serine/threonine protein phosphatase PrpC